MAKYRLYKNNNERSRGYGKYYARKAAGKLLTLDDLVAHMAGHNTAYSKGVIQGVITDMVECTRELAYEGNQVKIENLGIFQVSMKSSASPVPEVPCSPGRRPATMLRRVAPPRRHQATKLSQQSEGLV